MQRILEHTKLIERLEKYKIYLQFIKKYKLDDLEKCCDNLEYNKISSELYISSEIIQKELIVDEKFIDYLKEINNRKISLENLEELLLKIQDNGEKISDYNLKNVIDTLMNQNLNYKTHYDYLKYFSDMTESLTEKNIIAKNLEYFSYQNKVSISELDEKERNLFVLPIMSDYHLIPGNDVKRVCEYLVQDIELKNIILFLFDNDFKIPLNIKQYELIMNDSKDIYDYLCKLFKMLDNEQMYQLLLRWLSNYCNVYDLKILEERLQDIEKSEIEKIFWNRSSYINFIFKNKLSKFPLEQLSQTKENILIYAIHNNKKAFLKLIEEKQQEFLDISDKSILFDEEIYSKYININTLTLKNLIELQSMYEYKLNEIKLLRESNYTFEEIKLLYYTSSNYIKLYNCLLDLKIDTRMLIIKQLFKKDLLNRYLEDGEIEKLAEKLKVKNLYSWLENDFSHINQINVANIVDILINYDNIKKFIPQISNQIELLYILRNIERVQEYNSLETIKEDIEKIDKYWKELYKNIDLNENFMNENKQYIKEFLLNNGAELSLTYYKNCRYKNRRII